MTFENKALNIIKQFFISQLLQINLQFIIWTLGHTSFKTSSKHQPRRLKNVNFRKSNFDRYARVKNALELHPQNCCQLYFCQWCLLQLHTHPTGLLSAACEIFWFPPSKESWFISRDNSSPCLPETVWWSNFLSANLVPNNWQVYLPKF